MSETGQLMVEFVAGVDEDTARAAVEAAGGKVRRRMRTDGPGEVMLLVKAPGGLDALEAAMKAHPKVARTERDQDGYSISG